MQANRCCRFDWQWRTERIDLSLTLNQGEDKEAEQERHCGQDDRRDTRPRLSYAPERLEAVRKQPRR